MEPEAEAKGVDHPAHRDLWSHVFASDAPHVLAAPPGVQFVHLARIIAAGVPNKRNPDKGPKLNAIQARQIRELYADGQSVLALAERFGVSDQTVKDVLNFETWGSAGGPRKQVER